jgi:hypothetical protein
MLNRFYIVACCMLLVHLVNGQHLQLVENKGEIGIFAGKSSYIGDIAPDRFTFKNSKGAFFKKQFNDYGGIKLNYEQISLGAEDQLSKNPYASSRGFFFSRDFHDISLIGEFNFTRYLPGNKYYRFTPYLGVGVGYMISMNKDTVINALKDSTIKNQYLHFPVQLGFRFNLTQRWNLFAEALYRFTTTDEIDNLVDGKTKAAYLGYQGSRSGKDQFFSAKAGISYNLIKIYGEEKWKPGKKSRLASLKEKESGDKKPGFFSRLKFKRK